MESFILIPHNEIIVLVTQNKKTITFAINLLYLFIILY